MDTGSVLTHCICKMGICWRDIRQAKKTYAVGSAEMEISNTTKKAPHLSRPLIRPKPRSSKQTHPGGASDWLEGRCVIGCDAGLPALWIEKRGSRRTERTKLSKTIGCWRIVRFWGGGFEISPKACGFELYLPLFTNSWIWIKWQT